MYSVQLSAKGYHVMVSHCVELRQHRTQLDQRLDRRYHPAGLADTHVNCVHFVVTHVATGDFQLSFLRSSTRW